MSATIAETTFSAAVQAAASPRMERLQAGIAAAGDDLEALCAAMEVPVPANEAEAEMVPARLLCRQMREMFTVGKTLDIEPDALAEASSPSGPARVLTIRSERERVVSDLYEHGNPALAAKVFGLPGVLDSIEPESATYSLIPYSDGSMIASVVHKIPAANLAARMKIDALATKIEDLMKPEDAAPMVQMFSDAVAQIEKDPDMELSAQGKARLPALCAEEAFALAKGIREMGASRMTVPVASIDALAKMLDKRVADGDWMHGVSVSVDGATVASPRDAIEALGGHAPVSLEEALARMGAKKAAASASADAPAAKKSARPRRT